MIPRPANENMKTIIVCGALLIACLAQAQIRITRWAPDGTLTWTNFVSNAVYRVEHTGKVAGPWTDLSGLTSVQATNYTTTVQVPVGSAAFYRVVWADAPPASPVGRWEYSGNDAGGRPISSGSLAVASASPLGGTFTLWCVGVPHWCDHPEGMGSILGGSVEGTNWVTITLPSPVAATSEFRLRGQMVMDRYWGDWSFTDWSGDNKTGTFVAVRTQ